MVSKVPTVLGPLLALIIAAAVFAPPAEATRWNGLLWSSQPDSDCRRHADPIGVVFHGTAAKFGRLGSFLGQSYHEGDIERHTRDLRYGGWGHVISGPKLYAYKSYGSCDEANDAEVGSEGVDRHHVRLWQQPRSHVPEKFQTVGTPHWDEYGSRCDKHHVPEKMRIPAAWGGGSGSGYDYTRRALLHAYRHHPRHDAHSVYWGNNTIGNSQCRGSYFAFSNGYVNIIRVGR